MTRRSFLTALPAAAAARALAPRRPNVVIFYTDDHGYHDLGCQGATDLKTPHIDALAASGVRFTNWYSNAPVCSPARGSLMTGRYPLRCGVPNIGSPLRASELTLASLLKKAGYATGLTGKWHLGTAGESVPNRHGFDYFFGFHQGCVDFYSHRFYWGEPRMVNHHDLWRNQTEVFADGQYLTELITAEARGFIAGNKDKPFFLYVPYNATHYPMHAPKKYVDRFLNLELERRIYAAMLGAVDDGVGEIVGELRRHKLLDNTLLFFSSDNGATREPRAGLNQRPATAGSNAPFRGNKFSLFEGGVRVPAIMSWRGTIPAGRVVDEVGVGMDLLPTVCKLAGVELPADRTIDGRDVMPMVLARERSPHDAVFWAQSGQTAVRRGNWKLVVNGRLGDGTGKDTLQGDDAVFLCDLEKDPGETTNLRNRRPDVTRDLQTRIEHWLREVKQG